MFTQIKKTTGFTLIETLFYVVGAAVFLALIVTMFTSTKDWYRTAIIYPRVNHDGSTIVSRIGSDIRSGVTLNAAQNVFAATNGAIGINGLDSTRTAVTHRYYLLNGRIKYQRNGGTVEDVSPANLYVSKMRFDQVTSPISTGVRLDLNLDYATENGTTTKTYSSFSIMRNAYQ